MFREGTKIKLILGALVIAAAFTYALLLSIIARCLNHIK